MQLVIRYLWITNVDIPRKRKFSVPHTVNVGTHDVSANKVEQATYTAS